MFQQVLVQSLRPSDIVIIDNLGSHKGNAGRRHPRRRRKAVLPAALQPDLNPIEQVVAKLKTCSERQPSEL